MKKNHKASGGKAKAFLPELFYFLFCYTAGFIMKIR